MPDVEEKDDVQQHGESADPQATDAPPGTDGTQPATGDVAEVSDGEPRETDASQDPHPLDPDGKRFKQVWARAKTAEQEREAARQEAQREREERIRLEERLKAQDEAKRQAEPEYSWEQLEKAIEAGTCTRAWAQDYRERLVERRSAEAAERRMEAKLQTTSQDHVVLSELERYKRALPAINEVGSPEHTKVQREYAFLVGTLKHPPTYATQLIAARSAVGDIETVERTTQARRTAHAGKEPYMETQSTGGRPQPKAKDPIANLSPELKEHYTKMIKNNRYSGWDDVRKELEYVPPSLAPKRR